MSSASHSKKRKLKLVTLASIPVFGLGFYFMSYCYWLLTRHKKYKWLPDWTEWIRIGKDYEMKNKN